jgi:hypothetical protein
MLFSIYKLIIRSKFNTSSLIYIQTFHRSNDYRVDAKSLTLRDHNIGSRNRIQLTSHLRSNQAAVAMERIWREHEENWHTRHLSRAGTISRGRLNFQPWIRSNSTRSEAPMGEPHQRILVNSVNLRSTPSTPFGYEFRTSASPVHKLENPVLGYFPRSPERLRQIEGRDGYVFVKTQTDAIFTLRAEPSTSIRDLTVQLYHLEGIPPHQQRLVFEISKYY